MKREGKTVKESVRSKTSIPKEKKRGHRNCKNTLY